MGDYRAAYEILAADLAEQGVDVDAVKAALKRQHIETPSWGYANSGTRFKAFEDAALFQSLPGAGKQLAPRLLVAFGEDRSRFASPEALCCYAGIAPVTERSGNKSWVHWRYSCPKFLRQSFIEWANETLLCASILQDPAREGENPSDGYSCPGVQVDTHTLALLAGS